MSSVTLASRMRRVMLVLAAAAVLVMMMAFSAAPAMAGAAIPEPAQPVVTEPVLDNVLGLTGLANDLGIVSIERLGPWRSRPRQK
jgi:hypothetical protein